MLRVFFQCVLQNTEKELSSLVANPRQFSFVCVCLSACSVVSDSVIPRTITCYAPLCMEFSRQEYRSGLPFPFPGDLPNTGIKLWSPRLLHSRQILYYCIPWEAVSSVPTQAQSWNSSSLLIGDIPSKAHSFLNHPYTQKFHKSERPKTGPTSVVGMSTVTVVCASMFAPTEGHLSTFCSLYMTKLFSV